MRMDHLELAQQTCYTKTINVTSGDFLGSGEAVGSTGALDN